MKALRLALGMTVVEFCGCMGVTGRTVARWEGLGGQAQPRAAHQVSADSCLERANAIQRARFTAWLTGESLGHAGDGRRASGRPGHPM
jgi:hypothetical protein